MKNTQTILGIDPGSRQLGYGVILAAQHTYTVQAAGTVDLTKYTDYTEKIRLVIITIDALFKAYQFSSVAVEDAFYGKNPQSMLKLGRMQGAILTIATYLELPAHVYSPNTIKLAVGTSGRSSKEQVAGMLRHQVENLPPNLSNDATDAVAIALCHALRSSATPTQ